MNRQIALESRKVFHDLNVFVRIETPWPDARRHVNQEGYVPIIAWGKPAAAYTGYGMRVGIDAPEVPLNEGDEQVFLTLLEDLPAFCKMWFYSSLSHPGLNPQLRLTIDLQDRRERVPKSLQRKLLLPFGIVKSLRSVLVTGTPAPDPTVVADLEALQAVPLASPESCLREGTRLKAAGNAELVAGNYARALELYNEAWLAIHVVVKGRRRHDHADAFFASHTLTEAPYTGKNGQSERLILRVQLVANTCQVYLKQQDYEECIFWGMRSIGMLRMAMGLDERRDVSPEDEAMLGFPAANEMGKIYYRVAVAKRDTGDKDGARKLLRVAVVYLPRDQNVRGVLASVALALG